MPRKKQDEEVKPGTRGSRFSHQVTADNASVTDLCAVASNPEFVDLDIYYCRSHSLDRSVMRSLAANPSLTELRLMDTCLFDDGAKLIAASSTITSLNLTANGIGAAGAAALARNTVIITLNLCLNRVGEKGAVALAANNTLRSLQLHCNDITVAAARAFALNTSLTSIDLSNNNLGDEGAAAIAANTTLQSMGYARNKLTDAGVAVLVQRNATLRRLYVPNNRISLAGIQEFCKSKSLYYVECYENPADDTDRAKSTAVFELFRSVLRRNQQGPRLLFIRGVLLLARDAGRGCAKSGSLWASLPNDLRLYILKTLCDSEAHCRLLDCVPGEAYKCTAHLMQARRLLDEEGDLHSKISKFLNLGTHK